MFRALLIDAGLESRQHFEKYDSMGYSGMSALRAAERA